MTLSIAGQLHRAEVGVEAQQGEGEGGRGRDEGPGPVPVHRLARPRHAHQHPPAPQLHQEIISRNPGQFENIMNIFPVFSKYFPKRPEST